MAKKEIDFNSKKNEKTISSIGAKIADADEMNDEINALSEKSAEKLEGAQEELSDLYESIGEEEHKTPREKPQAPAN